MVRFLVVLVALALLLPPAAVGAQPAPPPAPEPEVRALWVDAFHDGFKTRAQVDELVAWARQANFNALFVQVRRRGDAYYAQSPLEPRTEDPDLEPGFDPLAYLIARAHEGPQPLQVHAWLATLVIWAQRDTPPASAAHVFNRRGLAPTDGETWLMLRDDGESWAGEGSAGTYYLDPGNPDAARYTVETYLNVLRRYDVDGIHLDQARYFEGRGQDRRWGYNPRSVQRFNAASGRPEGSTPAPSDPAWMAWRRDQVTALVRRIYVEAKAIKPTVAVTSAVIAWGRGPETTAEWERSAPFSGVFQDWRSWLAEGILDYALPMDYYRETPQQGAWLDGWMAFQQANRGKRGVVIGLGAYLNAPEGSASQLRRARQTGALGTAYYSYAVPAVNGDSRPRAAREAVLAGLRAQWPTPAPVPDLPWLNRPVNGNLAVDVPGREGATVTFRGAFGERQVRTDGSGLAALVDVPAGRYSASVQGPGIDPYPFDLDVVPGQTALVRFALSRG